MAAEQLQPEAALAELAADTLALRAFRDGVEERGKAGNLAPELDFRGQAAGVLEDLEGHPQLGRDGFVLLETNGPAPVGRVREEPLVHGFTDPLLGDPGDGVHRAIIAKVRRGEASGDPGDPTAE